MELTPLKQVLKGTSEIFFAVISTTIALAAVFLPLLFLQGITGRLFVEFGVVIAGSVIISSFVALTLTPMLSSRLLKTKEKHSWFYYKTEPYFKKMELLYNNTLNSFMEKRWLAFVIMFGSIAIIYFFGNSLPSELSPIEDRGEIRVETRMPEGTSYELMDYNILKIVEVLQDSVKEIDAMISLTGGGRRGSNAGFVRLTLTDIEKRERSQQEIGEQITDIVKGLNDTKSFVIQSQSISTSRSGLPVQYVIQSTRF